MQQMDNVDNFPKFKERLLIKESSQPENQPALSKQISTVTSVEGNLIHGLKKTNVDIQHHLHQTQP
jgi:hypothetical protein